MKTLIVAAVVAITTIMLGGTACRKLDETVHGIHKIDKTITLKPAQSGYVTGYSLTVPVQKVPGSLAGHWSCKEEICKFELIGPDDAQLVKKEGASEGNFSVKCTKIGAYTFKFSNDDTSHGRVVELTGSYTPD